MKSSVGRWIFRCALVLAILATPVLFYLGTQEKLNPDAWAGHPDKGLIAKAMKVSYDLNKEFHTSWLGVEMRQHPSDLMAYQEFILETRPDVIIETGTWHGGLTLYLAGLVEAAGLPCQIITVDIDDSHWRETKAASTFDRRLLDRIHSIKGSSVADAVIEEVAGIVKDGRALVILDSDHSKEHVLAELRRYARFVPRGGYILVNDTTLGGTYLGAKGLEKLGPLYAVREFVAEDRAFALEPKQPRYAVSCMHGGVIRRVE